MIYRRGIPILSREDCLSIPQSAMPMVVLTDKLWGFWSSAISIHTKNRYSHSMMLWKPGEVVTQATTLYKTDDLAKWLNGQYRVKFWFGGWNHDERNAMLAQLSDSLNEPWYKRLYDWPGIVGQLFRAPWIQAPHMNYCSERVSQTLRVVDKTIPKRPSPGDQDRLFESRQDFRVHGIFDPELMEVKPDGIARWLNYARHALRSPHSI